MILLQAYSKKSLNRSPGIVVFVIINVTTNVDTYENNGRLDDLNGNVAPQYVRGEAQFFFVDLSEVDAIKGDYQWSAWIAAR